MNRLGLWVLLAVCFTIIVTTAIYFDYHESKLAFENNYEEVTLPGANATYWQKAKVK